MVQIGETSKDVGIKSSAAKSMDDRAELIEDLLGGTAAMRRAGSTWLPQEEDETRGAWETRLKRTILFEGYKDATRKLAAKPFSRPIALSGSDGLAPSLKLLAADADNRRTSLSSFGKALFEDALHYGVTHFLVDFPRRVGVTTGEDVLRNRVHPYFVHVPADAVIGWQSALDESLGRDVLTQVRIEEERAESDGPWGSKCVEYVRVWTPQEWSLWRKVEDALWQCVDVQPNTIGTVPLVTLYFNRTGFMCGSPALESLAWLNLAHWQSSSDQRNVLHVARVPFLSEVGVPSKELQDKVSISVGRVKKTTASPADYRIGWVEHSGAAIAAGAADLDKIEALMQKLGMEPMLDSTTARTATEVGAAQEGASTSLKDWARETGEKLKEGFELAAKYLTDGSKIPEDFKVQLFTDWELASGKVDDLNFLDRWESRGRITPLTLLREAARRGVFADGFDPQAEADETASNGAMPPQPTAQDLAALEAMRAKKGAAGAAA